MHNKRSHSFSCHVTSCILYYFQYFLCYNKYKEQQFIHSVNGNWSKTAKIIKKMTMWCWAISPFYDFCCFWFVAINIGDKLLFLYLYLVLYYQFQYFSFNIFRKFRTVNGNFSFSKWWLSAMLDFKNSEISLTNMIPGHMVIFHFAMRRPSTMLDLFGAHLDHPRRELVVFVIVQNLVVIDAIISIVWKLEYLACLAWKRPFMPQK